MKGGYLIIDLKHVALTSGQEENVPGTYQAAANAYGKATLVSGLSVGDTDYPDFWISLTGNAGTYSGTASVGGSTITVSVEEGDDVTVTVA